MEQLQRLISLYDLTNPFLWRYLLLPAAGAGALLGVLWIFVRNRSARAKRVALVLSAASPALAGMAALLAGGRVDVATWLAATGLIVATMGAGYFVFAEWDGVVDSSRERQAGPGGATPERRRRLERGAAVALGVFAFLTLVVSLYMVSRG